MNKRVSGYLFLFDVMLPEVVKDTRCSWLGLHNLKIIDMVQESLPVPRFKIASFCDVYKSFYYTELITKNNTKGGEWTKL